MSVGPFGGEGQGTTGERPEASSLGSAPARVDEVDSKTIDAKDITVTTEGIGITLNQFYTDFRAFQRKVESTLNNVNNTLTDINARLSTFPSAIEIGVLKGKVDALPGKAFIFFTVAGLVLTAAAVIVAVIFGTITLMQQSGGQPVP